jgi:hypothetical protein
MNTTTTSRETASERLRALTKQAADCVRPRLAGADRDGYLSFLNAMYHYTRHSGEKALKAERDCPAAAADLRAFFAHMHREERGHYLLAEADLGALGFGLDPATPAPVAAFDAYWESIRPEDYLAYVGALVVFENIAGHVGADVAAFVRRLGLAKTQCRWLNVHVEADEQHGREALALGEKYLAADAGAVLAGAERACALWIDIFRSAFDDRVALPRRPAAA